MTAPQNVPDGNASRGIASGWYPDPSSRHQIRYWDGFRWTEHVGDGGPAAVDPLPVVRPGAVPTGTPQPEAKRRPGCLSALLGALAGIGVAIAFMVGTASVLGLGLADDPPGWLRPVAIGLAVAALLAVLDVRKRRGPPTGRY